MSTTSKVFLDNSLYNIQITLKNYFYSLKDLKSIFFKSQQQKKKKYKSNDYMLENAWIINSMIFN